MEYRYRNIAWIKPMPSNCLIFTIWYVISKRKGRINAEFDKKLCFWHFSVTNGDKEIHLEQVNRKAFWLPIMKVRIKIYQLK